MAGGNHPKGSSNNKPSSSSSSHRKSRWESDQKSSGAGDSKKQPPPTPKSKGTPSNSNSKDPKNAPNLSPAHPKPPSGRAPNSGPGPGAPPFPLPDAMGPPPPPAYDFHMLDRKTIALADGTVRSYFALPPDYQDFTPPPRPVDPAGRFFPHGPELGFDRPFPRGGAPMSPNFREEPNPYARNRKQDYWNSLGLDGRGGAGPASGPLSENSLKRKFGEEEERGRREEREGKDEQLARQRQQLLHYGNMGSDPNGYPMGLDGRSEFMAGTSSPYGRDMGRGGDELRAAKYMRPDASYENMQGGRHGSAFAVDQGALKKVVLHFAKLINENVVQKKSYLADGKQGPLQCIACGRSSKDFPDMHSLISHTYNSGSADSYVEHLGLHKTLCILMGWNYLVPPDNLKAYQLLSNDEAAANRDDLIMWPPMVIIHNTATGKGREGRMEGLGNKAMDLKLRDLGCGGKSKSLYSKEGHLGITLVKFAGDESGLKDAVRLAEYFEKDNHGRRSWGSVQSLTSGKDEDNNPNLVKVDRRTGEKERILFGYLGTAFDLDKIDFDTRKKVAIESLREFKAPSRA